jgi:class 3 adenylate cyclase
MSARAELAGGGELATFGRTFDSMVGVVEQHIAEIEAAKTALAQQAESLQIEQQRSEKLLLNVLPAAIADRLKDGEGTIAESYPEVTVLFSDIVGFTEMSARIGAKQVVDMLNEVFGLLDELAEKHSIEKIKTIGDCYMVVAGVPDRSPTHAQQIAAFALDMQETLQVYAEKSGRSLSMRTGMHTGTVVAGIVGTSKFAYDLWGDVVNIASRMESSSEAGRIQVSDAVRIRLADDFVFEARGDIDIKGKGMMHTWYLTGRRGDS